MTSPRPLKSFILSTCLVGVMMSAGAAYAVEPQVTQAQESQMKVTQERLSFAQIKADLDLARAAHQDIHPGYTRFTDAAMLSAAWDKIEAEALAGDGLNTRAFYLALSATLALIRCDHTKAELPRKMAAARKTAPAYLPLQWTILDGRAVIIAAPEGSGLQAGDEIISIDGRSIAAMQQALHRYIPVDGYNDHVRDAGMTASLEFMGGAVDHFGTMLWDVPETATLEIETAQGIRRTISLPRAGHKAWSDIAVAPDGRNFKDAVDLTRLGERGALLRIDTFVNYRNPVDPHSLYQPVFEALAAEGRDQLILDLRQNGGGSSEPASILLSYFLGQKHQWATAELFATLNHDAYVDYIDTWDKRAVNPPRLGFKKQKDGFYKLRSVFSDADDVIKPSKPRFKGELIVLTSRDNSSGSTHLIGQLREVRDVTLIGEVTGGNPTGVTAGSIFFLTLPHSDIKLRIPVIRTVMNVTGLKDGYGLVPDIAAPNSVDSVRAGRDPAMEAALAQFGLK